MKKTMTKVFALFLSLAMCAVMAVPAMASSTKTSFDFFKAMGAKNALNILNHSKYSSYIQKGSSSSATNLQNMYRSLEIIERTNYYRSRAGLKTLLVNDSMMAMGQVNCDYAAKMNGHSGQFNHEPYYTVENLNWGRTNPKTAPDGWYDEVNTGAHDKGHYKSMMDQSGIKAELSGAAVNSGALVNEEIFGTKQFNLNGEKAYTVSQYRTRLKNYMNQVGASTSSKSQSNKPTATSTSDSGNVQMKYTITPVENTNKQSNNGTTRNSNGVYSCTTSTVAHSTDGNSNLYKDYRGSSFNAWPKQDGKVYAYVQEMTNDSSDGFYADVRIFNGTDKTITLQDMRKLNIYSDDGLICSSPSSIWLGFGKTLAPNSQAILLKVRFNNVNANKNFTTGTLRVESTVTYTLA